MSDRPFITGLALSRQLYETAVRPILGRHYPDVPYSAALIGDGSDVLGFDTEQSTDHGWGPRLRLFLSEADYQQLSTTLDVILQEELPPDVSGYPIDMAWFGMPEPPAATKGRRHRVEIHDSDTFFRRQLGRSVSGELSPVDWLLMPQQSLRSVTEGAVFHDGLGLLGPLREKLRYYPDDVWIYLLAAQWRRVAQEEAFMGRCAQVGDDIGSRLVTARIVDDLMSLAFLMERTYAPYRKWFGTAFRQLVLAKRLEPALKASLAAGNWPEREAAMVECWRIVASAHNDLGITAPLPTEATSYYERPFVVIHAERFERALLEAICDPAVAALPQYLGGVDQFVDTTDLLSEPTRLDAVATLFREDGS